MMRSRRFLAGVSAVLLVISFTAARIGAKEPVTATHGMVVAQEPLAADVGLAVLKSGGNAVDAAVAIGFALAVTYPLAGNLGGGGFMLVRLANGKSYFVDFREEAPAKASRDMYLAPDGKPTKGSLLGWRAPGISGSVKGFETAQKKWGKLTWTEDLAPAIKLARDGFTVDKTLAGELTSPSSVEKFDTESKRIYLRDGKPYAAGETLRQADLAATLERIAKTGGRDFYEGETAHKLAAAMAANGGLISLEDLKNYRAIVRAPLEGNYHGYHIITSPPPSAGGVGILQMLEMLEGTGYDSDGADSLKEVHYAAEAMRRFYADRSEYLGDPAYYHVPLKQLLAPAYVSSRRATIAPGEATPSSEVTPGLAKTLAANRAANAGQYESSETTHYNVVDAAGNAVAVTYTLNGYFGCGVTVPGLGFPLNNEMDDFAAKPGSPNMFGLVGGEANSIQPGKRPLSSMDPTIVTRGGKLFMAVGAPGGSMITTGVLQVMLDVMDFHMNPQDAVDLPRFHNQWKPDVLFLQNGFNPTVAAELAKMGYTTKATAGVARVEAIVVRGDGVKEGGTESWLNGKVAGY